MTDGDEILEPECTTLFANTDSMARNHGGNPALMNREPKHSVL
jgi:hypothetical protein